jgi:hypothetical protein
MSSKELWLSLDSPRFGLRKSEIMVEGQKFWYSRKARTPMRNLEILVGVRSSHFRTKPKDNLLLHPDSELGVPYMFFLPSWWEERSGGVHFTFWQLHKIDNFGCQQKAKRGVTENYNTNIYFYLIIYISWKLKSFGKSNLQPVQLL